MRAGKKSIAERIVYDALGMLSDRLKKEDKAEEEGKGGKGGKSSEALVRQVIAARSRIVL